MGNWKLVEVQPLCLLTFGRYMASVHIIRFFNDSHLLAVVQSLQAFEIKHIGN